MIVLRQKEYKWTDDAKALGRAVWDMEKQEWKEHPWRKGAELAVDAALMGLTFGGASAGIAAAKASKYGIKGYKAYKKLDKVRDAAGVIDKASKLTGNIGKTATNIGRLAHNTPIVAKSVVKNVIPNAAKSVVKNPKAAAKTVGKWALNTTKESVSPKGLLGMEALGATGLGVGLGLGQKKYGVEGPLTAYYDKDKKMDVQEASVIPSPQPKTPELKENIQETSIIPQQKPKQEIQPQPKTPDYDKAVKEIWRGDWGNGHDVRRAKAKELGLDYEKLRQQVNQYKK